jgi:hypothetical protein
LIGMVLQVLEPALQFQDRFFEVQRVRFHGGDVESLKRYIVTSELHRFTILDSPL